MRGSTFLSAVLLFHSATGNAIAHDLPLSYVDIRQGPGKLEVTVESSAKNFARALPGTTDAAFLDPAQRENLTARIFPMIESNFSITEGGAKLQPRLRGVQALTGRAEVRVLLEYPATEENAALHIACTLFGADPRHRAFLNIYDGGGLKRQAIFDRDTEQIDYEPTVRQSNLAIVWQFLLEGIHHIFIGPDHILFIVGLLLLGGSLGELLKIVTAFTLAHSVTLVLATLNIVTPPPRAIEPLIALSIIFVGIHALLQDDRGRDWRLLFAFGFGFVHGFGFANVLREMALPQAALGWSLFSFNLGVEIGQACIVLLVTPIVAWVYRRGAIIAGRFVAASSSAVIFAGSYWFTERVFGG